MTCTHTGNCWIGLALTYGADRDYTGRQIAQALLEVTEEVGDPDDPADGYNADDVAIAQDVLSRPLTRSIVGGDALLFVEATPDEQAALARAIDVGAWYVDQNSYDEDDDSLMALRIAAAAFHGDAHMLVRCWRR